MVVRKLQRACVVKIHIFVEVSHRQILQYLPVRRQMSVTGRQSRVVHCALHMSHTAHPRLAAKSALNQLLGSVAAPGWWYLVQPQARQLQHVTVAHFIVTVSNACAAAVHNRA